MRGLQWKLRCRRWRRLSGRSSFGTPRCRWKLRCRNSDACQACAAIERLVPDGSYAAWDYIRSGFASWICDKDSLVFVKQDPFYAAICRVGRGSRYRCQVETDSKRIVTDGRYAAADSDVCQAGTMFERRVSDGNYVVRYGDACQAAAAIERIVPDGSYAIWYRDISQGVAVLERRVPDGSYCQACKCVRDGHIAAEAGVISDGASAVAVVGPCVIFGENYGWEQ